ncbi:dTMP kinase [Tengunoibacter tsumagoiensis]|uniref:Thymidylate kinase n=1 Tax=Tengunoibacter tsumagoiensis TaxID=2014871 RepID=A0A401ZYV0_9CHLR|nr:dTMP kinase [Tengunoibacter tsumagoiensis]GCE12029.1 thymidylate kinase [Tengunoibacter tsumagoiensis]
MSKGRLISFEGLDGAGKTTQMDLLERWLRARQLSYIRTREPGGTPLGIEIRRLLFQQPELALTPLAEAFLFQADRAQHFETLILPALAEGKLVVTDRCFDSSIAYQGAARGVGTARVEQLSLIATQGHVPDLTIFLDLDPQQVQQRTDLAQDQSGKRDEVSRFDRESVVFHQRLRETFLCLAQTHPERIKIVQATRSITEVQQEIILLVEQLLMKDSKIV